MSHCLETCFVIFVSRLIFAESIRDMETRRVNYSGRDISETIAESIEAGINDRASSVPKKKIKLNK